MILPFPQNLLESHLYFALSFIVCHPVSCFRKSLPTECRVLSVAVFVCGFLSLTASGKHSCSSPVPGNGLDNQPVFTEVKHERFLVLLMPGIEKREQGKIYPMVGISRHKEAFCWHPGSLQELPRIVHTCGTCYWPTDPRRLLWKLS